MKKPWIFRPFEFWPNETHEIPFHLFLLFFCLIRGISPKSLLKANYGLPYAGLGFASKWDIQQSIGADKFPKTLLVDRTWSDEMKIEQIKTFGKYSEYPLILKPDVGMTGQGMMKLHNSRDIKKGLPLLTHNYLLQTFIPGTLEFGIFYERIGGKGCVTGINRKYYPTVVGDGKSSVGTLAKKHPRYTEKWNSFLRDHDLREILVKGERKKLSSIGSHTLGAKFTDESKLLTPQLEAAVNDIFRDVEGFNYGRLDIKTKSVAALKQGEFHIIEVNGIESQPTQMFHPTYTWRNALKTVWGQARRLTKIAKEHKHRPTIPVSWKVLFGESYRAWKFVQSQQRKAENLK